MYHDATRRSEIAKNKTALSGVLRGQKSTTKLLGGRRQLGHDERVGWCSRRSEMYHNATRRSEIAKNNRTLSGVLRGQKSTMKLLGGRRQLETS